MPYIVTTTTPPTCPDCGRGITLQPSGWWTHDGLAGECWRSSMDGPGEDWQGTERHAVATLDEAHDYLGTMTDDDRTWNVWCCAVNAYGGSIGPLPDGTVIEVEQVSEHRLRDGVPAMNTFPVQLHADGSDLIDAFNAAQES